MCQDKPQHSHTVHPQLQLLSAMSGLPLLPARHHTCCIHARPSQVPHVHTALAATSPNTPGGLVNLQSGFTCCGAETTYLLCLLRCALCRSTSTSRGRRPRSMHCCSPRPTLETACLPTSSDRPSTPAGCPSCTTWCHRFHAAPWWDASGPPSPLAASHSGPTAQCLAPW